MTRVAVVPPLPQLEDAVRAGGGQLASADEADAIVWTNPFDPEGLRALLATSGARWVQLPFAGIEAFVEAGVVDPARTWTCAKGIYGRATAEQALALLLACARQLARHARTRGWLHGHAVPHVRTAGTTALILGTGGIGRALARMLEPLHVRVIAVNRSGAPLEGAERTVTIEGLLDELPGADWVVLALPLTDRTRHVIGASELAAMKSTAWLINVGRGGLVDQDALVRALDDGEIAGAALDVTDPEPLPPEHPLWARDDVLITSHTANTFNMAVGELSDLVARNVRAFATGEPLEGLVDPALGY